MRPVKYTCKMGSYPFNCNFYFRMIIGGLMQVYEDNASLTQDMNTILLSTFITNHLSLTIAKITDSQTDHLNLSWAPLIFKALISHLTFIEQDDYKLYLQSSYCFSDSSNLLDLLHPTKCNKSSHTKLIHLLQWYQFRNLREVSRVAVTSLHG